MMGPIYACDHNVTGCGCHDRYVAYAPPMLYISEYDKLAVKRGKLERYWMEHTPQGEVVWRYHLVGAPPVRRAARAIARNQLEGRTRRRKVRRSVGGQKAPMAKRRSHD